MIKCTEVAGIVSALETGSDFKVIMVTRERPEISRWMCKMLHFRKWNEKQLGAAGRLSHQPMLQAGPWVHSTFLRSSLERLGI